MRTILHKSSWREKTWKNAESSSSCSGLFRKSRCRQLSSGLIGPQEPGHQSNTPWAAMFGSPGGGLFGSTNQGGGGGLFGAPAAGGFGAAQPAAGGFGQSSGLQQPAGGLFGSPTPQPAAGGFGQSTSAFGGTGALASSTGGNSLFGGAEVPPCISTTVSPPL